MRRGPATKGTSTPLPQPSKTCFPVKLGGGGAKNVIYPFGGKSLSSSPSSRAGYGPECLVVKLEEF